jgi:hypothetical protein
MSLVLSQWANAVSERLVVKWFQVDMGSGNVWLSFAAYLHLGAARDVQLLGAGELTYSG